MAVKSITIFILFTLVFPVLYESVGHRIVVDRQQQVRLEGIGDGDTLEQPGVRLLRRDHEHGLVETGVDEALLDLGGKAEIEGVLEDAMRTQRTPRVGGVSDIDEDA